MEEYLAATEIIDHHSRSVQDKARELTAGLSSDREKAVALFYFVRDAIKYDPFSPGFLLEHHKASAVLARGHGYCQHKSILLVALARAVGIPARLGFVDIRDHRLPRRVMEMMGGENLFIYHGYVELYLRDRWVHVSAAYDPETCRKNGFLSVEFDGVEDARDPAFDREGRPHIEFIRERGHFVDFPWSELCAAKQEFASKLGRDLAEMMGKWWGKEQ